MIDNDSRVQSPCVRICCLDDDDTCLGCFRSLDEIKAWGATGNDRRRAILRNAERRRDEHRATFPDSVWHR